MTQPSTEATEGLTGSDAAARDRIVAELAGELGAVRWLPGGVSGLAEDGREVRIEHTRGVTVEWIVLRAEICAGYEMDSELVLERNARLAFAAIVLANGVYWLRVALPLDSAELADPRRALALVTEGAGSLAPRRPVTRGPAFDYYAF